MVVAIAQAMSVEQSYAFAGVLAQGLRITIANPG